MPRTIRFHPSGSSPDTARGKRPKLLVAFVAIAALTLSTIVGVAAPAIAADQVDPVTGLLHGVVTQFVAGEGAAAVQGAAVTAFVDVPTAPVADAPDVGSLAATVITDASGSYVFPHLATGEYVLLVEPLNEEAESFTPAVWWGSDTPVATDESLGELSDEQRADVVWRGLLAPDLSKTPTITVFPGVAEQNVALNAQRVPSAAETSPAEDAAVEPEPEASSVAPVEAAVEPEAAATLSAELVDTGSVSGTVTDADNVKLAGVDVSVYPKDGGNIYSGITDESGNFSVIGIAEGRYTLMFPSTGAYTTQWWKNASDWNTAVYFDVTPGTPLTGMNAVLTLGGKISGTITNASGVGIPDIAIQLDPKIYGEGQSAYANTDIDGHYSIRGITHGEYLLSAGGAYNSDYVKQWWDSADSQSSAASLIVSSATDRTDTDFTLQIGGSISGTVTGSDGKAVANAQISAHRSGENAGSPAYASTDSDGKYIVRGLASGSYAVQVQSPQDSDLMSQWWGGQSSQATATLIAVTAGVSATEKDVSLQLGASISGTIRTKNGLPVSNISVNVLVAGGNGNSVGWAWSDSSGLYTVRGLPAGSYTLQYQTQGTDYLPQWWEGKATQTEATTIVVGSAEILTGRDVTLQVGASISGRISDAGGNPIADANVYAMQNTTGGGTSNYHSAQTDANGVYVLRGLSAGDYKVQFHGAFGSNYLQQWWDGKDTQNSAMLITVGATSALTGKNVTLKVGSSISGIVRGLNGVALANVDVGVQQATGGGGYAYGSGYATTDASGSYTVRGLPVGSYKLQFVPESGSEYTSQWWLGKATVDSATPLTVGTAQELTGKNVSLKVGGTVSGTVTGVGSTLAGGAVSGVSVAAYSSDPYIDQRASTTTNSDGTYALRGLSAGTYTLKFASDQNSYIEQWLGNRTGFSTADSFTVTLGQASTQKNAVLAVGASISGTVTAMAGGTPFVSARVDIYSATSTRAQDTIRATVSTDSDGAYTLTGIPVGKYQLRASTSYWPSTEQWLGGAATKITSEIVSVTSAGVVLAGKNFSIRPAGSAITGTVVGAAGAPLPGVVVDAMSPTGMGMLTRGTTDAAGKYSLTGLTAGEYKLRFNTSGDYLTRWSGNKTTLGGAAAVAVAASTTLSGQNMTLLAGGSISGAVTKTGSAQAFSDITVIATSRTIAGSVQTTTDENGAYRLTGLADAKYVLEFRGATAITRWSGNASTEVSANIIAVTNAAKVTGQNASLSVGGTITGTVRGTHDGATSVEADAHVSVVTTAGEYVANVSTDMDGTYRLDGLAPGSYKLNFAAWGSNQYVDQWWNNKSSMDLSDTIVVAAGSVLSSIDATLQTGGSISGVVSASAFPNAGLGGMSVSALSTTGETVAYALTDSSGGYTISGLLPGTYQIHVYTETGNVYNTSLNNYVPKWFGGQGTQATATFVNVAANVAVTGKNVSLAVGGQIRGQATASDPALAIGYAIVRAWTIEAEPRIAASTMTDAQGNYLLRGLVGSNYNIQISPAAYSSTYAEGWWKNSASESGATSVSVTTGSTTLGTNFVADVGGAIEGRVTNAAGENVSDISVSVWRLESDEYTQLNTEQYTDGTGQYSISGLPAGTYTLGFTDHPYSDSTGLYEDEFWNNSTTLDAATTFSLALGSSMTRNAMLAANAETLEHFVTSPTPTLAGTARVGSTLTANAGTWSPAPVVLEYAWQRGGVEISGATASTYVLVAADIGTKITASVTGSKSGYVTVSKTSAASSAVVGVLTATPVPTVSGTAQVGKTLTASAGSWEPSPVSLSYTWKRDGESISGAVAATYPLVSTDLGAKITVTVTGSKSGYGSISKTSTSSADVVSGILASAPVPTIAGTVMVGSMLIASSGSWDPASVALAYQWKRNGAVISGATSAFYTLGVVDLAATMSVSVTGSQAGYVSVTKTSVATTAVEKSDGTVEVPVTRLAGADRFSASAAISAENFSSGVAKVFVANGLNFPDALSGAPVAAKAGAPVLLVTPGSIPDSIAKELDRLKPGEIVVLGGVNSVSDAVAKNLGTYTSGTVTRLWGADRFSASAAISAESFEPNVATAYIASGMNFPDALSGAPVAAKEGAPVLLVAPDALPTSIETELKRLKPGRIVVLGGPNSVSEVVKTKLAALTSGRVTRLSGADRFSASADISAQNFAAGVATVYVASGLNFPDALSGAPVAAQNGSPVLLVSPGAIPESVAAELTRLRPGRIIVLGGVNSVSAEVFTKLNSYLG